MGKFFYLLDQVEKTVTKLPKCGTFKYVIKAVWPNSTKYNYIFLQEKDFSAWYVFKNDDVHGSIFRESLPIEVAFKPIREFFDKCLRCDQEFTASVCLNCESEEN